MRKKIAGIIAATQDQEEEQISEDLFFRRIEVQSTIIKKMLSEIDPSAKPEGNQAPEKTKDTLSFEYEENENQDI